MRGGAEDKQQDFNQFNARQFQVSFIFPGHISFGNLKFFILEGPLLYFCCACQHLFESYVKHKTMQNYTDKVI